MSRQVSEDWTAATAASLRSQLCWRNDLVPAVVGATPRCRARPKVSSPIAHRPTLPSQHCRRSFRRSTAARAARYPLRAPRNHTEMLRKSCTRRNAGLRRRAPPRPAVPRCQPARRRSRNIAGTDDGAALAARPRPGGQEGGAEQRHRRAAVLCTRLGRSRRQISLKSQGASDSSAE